MKKILYIVLPLFLSVGFCQKEYDLNHIVKQNGIYIKKFSDEKVNGSVYQMFGDMKVVLGKMTDGNKINFDCSVNTITDFSIISPINKDDMGSGVDVSFPNGMMGFYLYKTNTEKIGYYFDFRGQFSPISQRDSYYDKSTNWSEDFGDNKIGEDTDYMMLDIGVIKNISPTTFLYGGGGIGWKDNYVQYYDEFEILGKNGKYWVNDNSTSNINFIGGILILPKEDKFINQIKIGVNSTPLEISVGLGWSLFRSIR